MTLRELTNSAPKQDRGQEAFAPPPGSLAAIHAGCAPLPPSRFARTLYELRVRAREHGAAAVAEAKWCAITSWLMSDGWEQALSHPYPAASKAVMLCREHDQAMLAFPRRAPRPPVVSTLASMGEDDRAHAQRIAREIMRDWERAGRPCLTAKSIGTIGEIVHNSYPDPRGTPRLISQGYVYDNPPIEQDIAA